jgi:hypothetical protein
MTTGEEGIYKDTESRSHVRCPGAVWLTPLQYSLP